MSTPSESVSENVLEACCLFLCKLCEEQPKIETEEERIKRLVDESFMHDLVRKLNPPGGLPFPISGEEGKVSKYAGASRT